MLRFLLSVHHLMMIYICAKFGGTNFDAFKGRFLEFQRGHNFANLLSKLSESTFYKEISKFQ